MARSHSTTELYPQIGASGRSSEADAVIIATGGMTYPATGSTGDGYALARQVGHTVVSPAPSLVPLEIKENWPGTVSGLSLKNVKLTAFREEQKLGEEFGEMLFTHFGISGPIVLSLSRAVIAAGASGVNLSLDLKPALSGQQVDERLQRDIEIFSRRHLINSLDQLLPMALIPIVIGLSGIDPHKPCNQINKEERQILAALLKGVPLTVKGVRPVAEAIVTKGGVAVLEVSPKTMGSKLVKGLYFAGEVLDVDGFTGGFNLQAAWSSGFVAGKASAQNL
ncbi:MAG: aminoacetone oxidase family FAD-binding enzyme [Clostridiales bacterium]